MGSQFRPDLPIRRDLLDRHPPLEPLTWNIAGAAISDQGESALEGVRIKFVDKQTGVEVGHSWTDSYGRYSGKVVQNQAGYRVTPYKYPWAFCPGYYDVAGNRDLPYFRGIYIGK